MAPRNPIKKGAKPATNGDTSKTVKKRGTLREQHPSKRAKVPVVKTAKSTTTRPFKNVPPTTRLEIFVFGEGSAGELGLGNSKTAIDVTAPRLNSYLDAKSVGVVDLSTGGMHAAALTHDNKVLTWGINDECTLGRDTAWDGGLRDIDECDDSDESDSGLNPLESTPAAIPTDKFPPDTKIVQVAAGNSTTFVLTDTGLVYGWGIFRDNNGKYGFYSKPSEKAQKEPMLIPELKNITRLSVGGDYCLALDAEGTVFAWGTGDQGQLGRRLIQRRRVAALIPTVVAGLPKKGIISIHAGTNHAFAIDTRGDTWAWGSNNFAQTGIIDGAGEGGSSIFHPQRVQSLIGMDMKMVEGGSHHSIGITYNGECLVWGRMDGAQTGLDIVKLPLDDPEKVLVDERGKPRILLQPTPLPLPDCAFAAVGPDHNLVITSEGKAYSWGFNATYQCGQRTCDDILIATLIDNTAVRNKRLCWAGAGGQYSMLASPSE